MRPIRDRHVLLTGASRGIGAVVAEALAREGARLTLSARSQEDLARVRDEVVRLGAKCHLVAADLANVNEVHALVDSAEKEAGPIDILVNNAGIEVTGRFHELDESALTKVLDVNLRAPMILVRRVLPAMLERRMGSIVNVSSLAGKVGTPFNEPYSATKFGLQGFTEALRASYRDSGVGFSIVAPGFISEAGMHARSVAAGHKEPRFLGALPPKDVATAVVRAIRTNAAEILVTPRPMRPLLALGVLLPDLYPWVSQALGVRSFFADVAEARSSGKRID